MKDLKHLYYFESLLEEVNNDLVREGTQRGDIAIGSVCSLIPEVLLNLPGTFAVRLRAPRTGSIEMGTYYMTSLLCEGCRAYLERALEGGYEFLDCILAPDACAQMNRCVENIEKLQLCNKEKFFVSYADVPMKADETALAHYVRQMRLRVLSPLAEVYGIDVSDEALRQAVKNLNEVNRLMMEIGAFRKEENPPITGYEFAVLCLATYSCPHDLLIEKLEETLAEVQERKPDEKKSFRARVLLAGSELDSPELVKLAEDAGAFVAADRYCFGAFPDRQPLLLTEDEDVLTQICRQYMMRGQCPRYMNTEKIEERKAYIDSLAREYKVDGIIYQYLKFCDYWGYEQAASTHIMRQEYDYPVLSIDHPYSVGSSGQIRTRIQAFVESIEIKKLQKGAK